MILTNACAHVPRTPLSLARPPSLARGLSALSGQLARLLRGSALLAACSLPALATAATYVVGSGATPPPGATRVAQLTQVPWSTLSPGSEVIVSPGSYAGPVLVNARGTAAAPVRVRPSDTTRLPTVAQGLDFSGAAWVDLTGVVVQDSVYGAVVIRQASHHITVRGSSLRRNYMGVNITDGAGTGHRLLGNTITDSVTNGISIDGVNARASDRSAIVDNVVTNSGHHGMEIRGSWYRIEGNIVSGSGRLIGGTSGIHIYSRGANDDAGDHNLIRYNYSYANHEPSAADGNGIQIDQWSDANTVAYNVAWANDGAGIALFDAQGNDVYCNTVFDNMRDTSRTHTSGVGAEIMLTSATPSLARTANNRVYDNVVVSKQSGSSAMHVDAWSITKANVVGPNLFQHRSSGAALRWGNDYLYTASRIDQATGIADSLVEAVVFTNAAQPLANGLQLKRPPSLAGRRIRNAKDMLGTAPTADDHFHGAYYRTSGATH